MASPVLVTPGSTGLTKWIGQIDDKTYHTGGIYGAPVPFLSSSGAKNVIKKSLAHAQHLHPVLGEGHFKPTPLTDRGTILHAFLFGTEDLRLAVYEDPDKPENDEWRTKAAKAFRDEARAQHRIPIFKNKLNEYQDAAEWLRDYLRVHYGLDIQRDDREASEVAAVWVDPETGVQCQLKMDHVLRRKRVIWDLKCTGLANPGTQDHDDKIDTFIVNQLHDVQAAGYVEGAARVFDDSPDDWAWNWILFEWEDVPMVVVAELTPEMREFGMARWRWAVRRWARAIEADEWPGYTQPGAVLRPVPPPWEVRKIMPTPADYGF